MLNLWFLIPGILITGIAVYDIIFTTFAPKGASYISSRVATYTWKCILFISRKLDSRSILSGAGILIICIILLAWITSIWLGSALIFMSDPEAVLDTNTKVVADVSDRVYYAGYVLSTLGNGDFSGGSSGWQIYTAVLSFFGIMLITIAISYMVPVISAVTDRRTLSIQVASLGHCPQSILLNHWDGKSFKSLEGNMMQLKEKVALHGQLHLSYPILQYFQNNEKLTALMPNLIALDEALTIVNYMVPEQHRPDKTILQPMRIIVSSFFSSLASTTTYKIIYEVPDIKTDKLLSAGVPLKSPSEEQLKKINEKRVLLNSILENSGWHWNEIYNELGSTRFT